MFDAYSIGIKLSLVNNVSSGLSLIGQHFAKAQGHVTEYQKSLDKIKLTMLGGSAAVATGIFGFDLIGKTLGPAKEYAHQLSQLNVLGMKHAEIMNVVNKAWEVSRDVPTSSAADNIKAYRELRSAFGAGHEHEALAALAGTQMVTGILASVQGAKQDGVGFDMVKGLELTVRGALSQEVLSKRMGMMTQSIVGMGGTVDAHDFHMALKYAKSGASSYSEDFLFKYLPTLIQEFKTGKHGGASSAGTALNAGYRMIVGQQISKENFQNWIDAGLIDKSKIIPNKYHTGVSKLLPGAVAGAAAYSDNPEIWAQQYGLPGVTKLMSLHHLNQDQAIASLTKDSNKAFLLNTLINKAAQFQRDKQMIESADSFSAYQKLLKSDPDLANQALHKQWSNLLGVIGYQIMPDVVKGTLWLVDHLKSLSQWVTENGKKVKALVGGFGLLSAALVFGGTVTLLTGAIKGLGLVLQMAPVGGAFGIARLAASLTGIGTGLGGIGGATGFATLGATLGGIAGGLVLLGGAVAGMAWLANVIAPNHKRGERNLSTGEVWEPGPNGRGGHWMMPTAANSNGPHAGEHFVRSGRGGHWTTGSAMESYKPSGKIVQVHTQVNMDGFKVANIVSTHQAKSANGPQLGTGRFDPNMGLISPGQSF